MSTIGLPVERRATGPFSRAGAPVFEERFVELFESQFPRVFRVLDRLSGDPELATDLTQEAFVRLYRRGAVPDSPVSWLITVAMNLHRNAQTKQSRRSRLLTLFRADEAHSDPPPTPSDAALADAEKWRVRGALARLPARDQRLLLLLAEGYSYREMAEALDLNPASVGTLMSRAKKRFRKAYAEDPDAS